MAAPLVGMAHIVRRHVGGGLTDQVLKEIAIGLRDPDGLQRHAVFAQRGLHVLERLTHPTVFRQQVVAQRTGDGAGDTAIQRCLDQTIKLAAIRGGAQTTRHHAQIEHQRMIVGDRVKRLKLHPFDGLDALLQLRQRQHARLALAHRLGQ